MAGEIDAIFGKTKKSSITRRENGSGSITKSKLIPTKSSSKVGTLKSQTTNTKKDVKVSKKGVSDDPFGIASRTSGSLDRTEEGWKIYTEDELNLGKGGDTELCPFDCDCCF